MGIEATGTIYRIDATQQVSERFAKREFIVEIADNPKYPQHVQFQCTGDRVSQLDGLNKGDAVRIEFSLRGRLYTSKKTGEEGCFTSLDCWKVEAVGQRRAPSASASNGGTAQTRMPDDDGEIPF